MSDCLKRSVFHSITLLQIATVTDAIFGDGTTVTSTGVVVAAAAAVTIAAMDADVSR